MRNMSDDRQVCVYVHVQDAIFIILYNSKIFIKITKSYVDFYSFL